MSVDVSVVIPTFRRPHTLVQALRSVLVQQSTRLEVLVIDDCPQGSAEQVVMAMGDARIRYLRNPQSSNGRPALVRNLGWQNATGELVHFLDDDDIVPLGHYAKVQSEFARLPDIGVVFGRIDAFGEREDQVRADRKLFADAARRAARTQALGQRWAYTARMFFQPLLMVCGAALVRRRCVEAIGGFNTSLELMEDVDFYARAIRRFGAHYLDCVALHYRVGPSLMHRPGGVQAAVERSYTKMYAVYRETWGMLDFLALKIAARTVLQVL
jgi:glycosyltransferase involved in cell wall biosynthesis